MSMSASAIEEYAQQLGNIPEMEKQWAVKALHQAETYYKLITSLDPSRLRLTKIDDEIYSEFKEAFPNLRIDKVEIEDFKSEKSKAAWREFIMKFEKKVADYNFGTLLRMDCRGDYTDDNSLFVTRVQFYAVEIARNREGLNRLHLNTPQSSP
ncbi:UPF0368 protein Cxorf26-like protein [Paraphysoderma sedebokerense]|nr:UPF0368 protein Cxorf26-like protein [Paraphysoderma sedebokerense]